MEDVEYDTDIDDERRSVDLPEQQQQFPESNRTAQGNGKAVIIVPVGTDVLSTSKNSSSDVPGQGQPGEQSALTGSSDETRDNPQQDNNSSRSPKYSRAMSRDETYFSEES